MTPPRRGVLEHQQDRRIQRRRPHGRRPTTQASHLGRPSPPDLVLAEAQGHRIRDVDGREYLDFAMGWCVANLGWEPEDVRDRVRSYDGPSYVPPHYTYDGWEELSGRLCRIAPGRMDACYRATGGTEAVEIALQAAMAATGRSRFVTLDGAYHGNSVLTHTLAGPEARKHFGDRLPNVRQVKPPLDGEALADVERLLQREDVAAFVMEPVVTGLGGLVPEKEFLEGVAEACSDTGTLLVLDEVASGFGRTGRMFATEHFGVEPDIVTLAKALTSGVAPLGATLLSGEVAEAVEGELSVYSTYGWHPLGVEAALGTLDVWDREGDRILENVRARGIELGHRLQRIPFGEDAKRTGIGLVHGVQVGEQARRIADGCRDEGLLLAPSGGELHFFPALTIDGPTLREGLDILDDVTRSVLEAPANRRRRRA
ncbi:MAG TPA: aspartate aminotransferase family protein [Candidatus Thermoplasmatota archaeon]|nr:aspartate aminotransferase family protein [Candidatus Thermoplasmatota archaeon]